VPPRQTSHPPYAVLLQAAPPAQRHTQPAAFDRCSRSSSSGISFHITSSDIALVEEEMCFQVLCECGEGAFMRAAGAVQGSRGSARA
jgi:hypothetical protein